jgi:hypothetical protein
MAMYSFVPHSREAEFCGVPSCVFDKLGCVCEKSLRNTALDVTVCNMRVVVCISLVAVTKLHASRPRKDFTPLPRGSKPPAQRC